MKYDQHYRSAMDKITATDQWKAETLAKMAAAQPKKPLHFPRRVAGGLAACLVLAAVVGGRALYTGPVQTSGNAAAPDTFGSSAPAAAPRAMMAAAGPLFDAADVAVCQPQPEFDPAAAQLPVYADENGAPGEPVGEFALVAEADARSTLAVQLADAPGQLVYVCSAGYCQPAWQFVQADGGLCWAAAAAGVLPA